MKKQILLPLVVLFTSACVACVNENPTGVITPTPAQDLNIENEAVSHYLTTSNAIWGPKVGTPGKDFFDEERDYRPDFPNCKHLIFSNQTATTATVYLSTDADFSHLLLNDEVALQEGQGQYTLRNFVPGKIYYYKVVANNGIVLTSGALNITGQLRMITLDRGYNIRDLGGWKGLAGKTVRYEQIYRGASLGGMDMYGNTSDITDADKTELFRLGLRAQLDLRSPQNSGLYAGETSLHSYSRGETTLLSADFINIPLDLGAYNRDASPVQAIAWLIQELKAGRPVYFNCRQGADRTGTLAFVIEGLLGCNEYTNANGGNQMAMDYELTGFSRARFVDNVDLGSSYRPAVAVYNNPQKLFRQLLDMEAGIEGIHLETLQQKCYYYLNRYFKNGENPSVLDPAAQISISKDDLDWFIMYMLDMNENEYSAFRPEWAI